MKALYEWSTGGFIDLSRPNSEFIVHLENIGSRIVTKLVQNKLRDSELWKQLEVNVGQRT
jgi:hypothetical protein